MSSEQYEPSFGLLEEARKSWDYAVCDELVNIIQPSNINPDSFVGIAKDYIEGNCWIECHVTLEGKRNSRHACIIVECHQTPKSHRDARKVKVGNGCMNRNPSMLINVAEEIELPKQVAFNCSVIRSLVRLKIVDLGDCFCVNSPSVVPELLRVTLKENRKLRPLGIRASVVQGERKNQLVKRGTQAIQEIPDDKRNFVGRVFDLKPDKVHALFNIVLTENSAGARFSEQAQPFPHVFKMFLRPGCFQVGVSQRNGHAGMLSERSYNIPMKPLPAPRVPGSTESERFDNALRQVFSVSKDDLRKREAEDKKSRQRKKRMTEQKSKHK